MGGTPSKLDLGVEKMEQDDLAGAIADFTEQICSKPDNYEAYLLRANLRGLQGDYDGAIGDYRHVVRLEPDYDGGYFGFGHSKYGRRDYPGTMADCNEAIRLKPDLVCAYNNRGLAKHDQGNYAAAIADYDKAISLNADAVYYHNRATSKRAKGNYAGALADYNEAIRLKPDNVLFYDNCALTHELRGEIKQATKHREQAKMCEQKQHKKAIEEGAFRYVKWAKRIAAEEKHADAIIIYNEAIRLQSNFVEAYEHRANAYEALGKHQFESKDSSSI